jgi:nicotinate-nucleotide--dimethylbenzimidazole phosphoribosyltransferase
MKTFHIQPTDKAFAPQLQTKIDNLNKPKGSLGRLEQLALQIGLIQHSANPGLMHPCHILFAADHGIEREGVSVSPRDITWQQMENFTRGGGGVNLFCRQHGFHLRLVDVGVDHTFSPSLTIPYVNTEKDEPLRIIDRKIARGTCNFLNEAAMSADKFDRAVEIGCELVDATLEDGCNVVSFGEMGIANTSPSSVWMHFFEQIPLDRCVGAGAGLCSEGVRHKRVVLDAAIHRFSRATGIESPTPFIAPDDWTFCPKPGERPFFPAHAEEIIRWFGGFEMVAAMGGMLRAAEHRMVILVDGFIMTACMLAAAQLHPAVLDYAVFTHKGDESGHHMMLEGLGAQPLLSLGLRLGEGTGAICAYPLVDSAARMMTEMDNFEHARITKYF